MCRKEYHTVYIRLSPQNLVIHSRSWNVSLMDRDMDSDLFLMSQNNGQKRGISAVVYFQINAQEVC
jgi:hypothetical protein